MFATLKPSTMRLPFVKNYLPISQRDVVDGSQELEEGSGCSTSEFDSREKTFVLAAKPSFLSLYKRWLPWLPWLLCLCLVISNVRLWIKIKGLVFEDAVYSPVDVAAYGWKNVNFEAAIQDEMTEYQGVPNANNNKLWDDLFNSFGVSEITMEEARPLKNGTIPIDDEGHYIVTLDVFHQLHCLNKMRQKIYWNTTNYGKPEPSYINTVHIDHCIDQMRQSLMCTVDVTPIPYQWYPKFGQYLPSTGIMHTCRNFEAVQEWAKKRPARDWDAKKHRVDPLGEQEHIYKDWWCKKIGGCEWNPDSDLAMGQPHSHGSGSHHS